MNENIYVGDASKFLNKNVGGLHAVTTTVGMMPMNKADAAQNFMSTLGTDDKIWLANMINAENAKKGVRKADAFRGDDVSNQSLFFARALELLTAKVYEVQYEVLPFRDVFDVINEGGPGIKEIVSEVYDYFAKAKPINAAGKDIPMVDGGGKEIHYPVILWGIGAAWNIQELQSFVVAQRNGRARYSPEQIRQKAALRGIEEALNDQALFGTPETGIFGALTNPLIPNGPVAPSAASPYGTAWEGKSADEILADVNGLGDVVFVNTKMRERPNKLLLPVSKWTLIKNKRLENRDISIMTYLIENSVYFKSEADIIPLNELEGAGYSGTGKMMAFTKDPDKVCVEIPSEAAAMPVQQSFFSYLMLWYAYSAGAIFRYPRSAAMAEGI